MLTKLTKIKWKERIFKVTKEKSQVTYKGNPICLTDDLSTESLQPRRKWQGTFKVLKGKNLQPRLLYLARISFKIDGKSKSFSDKATVTQGRAKPVSFNFIWGLKGKKILAHSTFSKQEKSRWDTGLVHNYFITQVITGVCSTQNRTMGNLNVIRQVCAESLIHGTFSQ